MATPEVSNARALRTYTVQQRNSGSTANTARELGISERTVRRHISLVSERGIVTGNIGTSETFYADAPKIRVTVSNKPNEADWSGDVLVIGDAHDSPKLADKSRFLWMGRAAAEWNVDRIIQSGDFLTLDSLCRYDENWTLIGKDKPSFQSEINSGIEAMSAFDKGQQGQDVEKHITLGNHEARAISFTNRTPEVAGILTGLIDNLFMSHGWTYSPYGIIYFIGAVGFTHVPLNTLGKPYGGKTAIQRVANDVCHDLVYAHDHKGGDFPCPKIGTNQKITVLNAGCSLPEGHVEPYVGHGTSGWRYGVVKLKIREGRFAASSFVTMTELEERFAD